MNSKPLDELDRRRPVWDAMSALFLDTELDDARLREIAATVHASRYTEAELDNILTNEIAPLLYPNLRSPAGVWEGFDCDWIEQRILAGEHLRIRRWYNLGSRLICNRIVRSVRKHYWDRVLEHLRSAEPPKLI